MSGDKGIRSGAYVRLRDQIVAANERMVRQQDQVALGRVTAVSGASVQVRMDGFGGGTIPVAWAVHVPPQVGDRVLMNGLSGGQVWFVTGVVGETDHNHDADYAALGHDHAADYVEFTDKEAVQYLTEENEGVSNPDDFPIGWSVMPITTATGWPTTKGVVRTFSNGDSGGDIVAVQYYEGAAGKFGWVRHPGALGSDPWEEWGTTHGRFWCRIRRTSDQSITSGSWTFLDWQSIEKNPDTLNTWWTSSPDPERIYLPYHGLYVATLKLRVVGTDNDFRMRIGYNHTTADASEGPESTPARSDVDMGEGIGFRTITGIVEATGNDNDFVTAAVLTSANVDIESDTSSFTVAKIS